MRKTYDLFFLLTYPTTKEITPTIVMYSYCAAKLAVHRDMLLPKFKRENDFIPQGINSNDGTIRAL